MYIHVRVLDFIHGHDFCIPLFCTLQYNKLWYILGITHTYSYGFKYIMHYNNGPAAV